MTMRGLRAAAIPLALLMLVGLALAPASAAKTTVKVKKTAFYEAPGERVSNRSLRRTDPLCDVAECQTTDGQFDAGGVTFDPIGNRGRYKRVTVKVWDDWNLYGHVSVHLCDSIAATACSNSIISRFECLQAGEALTVRDVPRNRYFLVQVYGTWSCTQFVNDVPDNQGGGVSGKVKAVFVYVK